MPPPPAPPADILANFGTPEAVFGPNLRFRRLAVLLGCVVILLGSGFFAYLLAKRLQLVTDYGFESQLTRLAAGLIVVGTMAIVLPLSRRRVWHFVCPGGLLRWGGDAWDTLSWAEVARFDDGTVETTRQFRLHLLAGEEWLFHADWVTDFDKLRVLLREKTRNRPGTGNGDTVPR